MKEVVKVFGNVTLLSHRLKKLNVFVGAPGFLTMYFRPPSPSASLLAQPCARELFLNVILCCLLLICGIYALKVRKERDDLRKQRDIAIDSASFAISSRVDSFDLRKRNVAAN